MKRISNIMGERKGRDPMEPAGKALSELLGRGISPCIVYTLTLGL